MPAPEDDEDFQETLVFLRQRVRDLAYQRQFMVYSGETDAWTNKAAASQTFQHRMPRLSRNASGRCLGRSPRTG